MSRRDVMAGGDALSLEINSKIEEVEKAQALGRRDAHQLNRWAKQVREELKDLDEAAQDILRPRVNNVLLTAKSRAINKKIAAIIDIQST